MFFLLLILAGSSTPSPASVDFLCFSTSWGDDKADAWRSGGENLCARSTNWISLHLLAQLAQISSFSSVPHPPHSTSSSVIKFRLCEGGGLLLASSHSFITIWFNSGSCFTRFLCSKRRQMDASICSLLLETSRWLMILLVPLSSINHTVWWRRSVSESGTGNRLILIADKSLNRKSHSALVSGSTHGYPSTNPGHHMLVRQQCNPSEKCKSLMRGARGGPKKFILLRWKVRNTMRKIKRWRDGKWKPFALLPRDPETLR